MKTVYVTSFHHIDYWHGVSDPAQLADMVGKPCSIENARAAFSKAGWEGDGSIGAIWIPPFLLEHSDTYGTVVWHVKQSNNGTSWLCASEAYEFPGLQNAWKPVEVDEPEPDPNAMPF